MGALKLGAIVVTLFFIALINDWSTPDVLILTMLALLAVGWIWSRLSLQRLGLTRSLSLDRVRAGELVTEEFQLTNKGVLPKFAVEVRDFSSLPGHRVGRVMNLRSRGSVTWTTTSLCRQRGRYRLGPIVVAGGDPTGLFSVHKSIPASHELLVYPPVVDVSRCQFPAASLTGGPTAMSRISLAAHTVSGLRDYVSGDPMNRISWSATARTGKMMVKEFDPDPTSDLWIMLDLTEEGLRPLGHRGGYDVDTGEKERLPIDTSEEFVVAIAGSLAERAITEGRRVGLLINRAIPLRIEPDTGQRQWFRLLETLAVAATFGSRSIGEGITAESARFSRSSGLVVITAAINEDWVALARSLVLRHVPVTAAIVTAGSKDPLPHSNLISELVSAHIHVAAFNDEDAKMVQLSSTPWFQA